MTVRDCYRRHGGIHQVAIVLCPEILGHRLGHLSQDGPGSWVLRDFVTRRMIRNSPPPNYASSSRMLAESGKRESGPCRSTG